MSKQTDILLVNPPLSFVYGFKQGISSVLPPLGLLSIGASLRSAKFNVKYYDLEFKEDEVDICEALRQRPCSVVAITLATSTFPVASSFARTANSPLKNSTRRAFLSHRLRA